MGLSPFADEPLTSGGMLGDACRLLCLSAYTRVGLSKWAVSPVHYGWSQFARQSLVLTAWRAIQSGEPALFYVLLFQKVKVACFRFLPFPERSIMRVSGTGHSCAALGGLGESLSSFYQYSQDRWYHTDPRVRVLVLALGKGPPLYGLDWTYRAPSFLLDRLSNQTSVLWWWWWI